MVFQNPGSSLNPRRTVGQSIAVPLAAHGTPGGEHKRRIAELLEMVQLPADFALRYPHELSGGQEAARRHRPGAGGGAATADPR